MRARRRIVAVSVALALLAACDGAEAPGSDGPDAPPSAPGITSGGSAIFGVYGEPATLDPYSPLASDLTYALARPVYRSLYRFTPGGEAVPDLVRALNVSGEVATITLVRARWSDGARITSRDVIATIRRARPPSGLALIESVTRRGPRRMVLSGNIVDWPEILARVSFVLPARRSTTVYSGPFSVRSRVPGLQIVLEPNPEAALQPYLDRITVRFTDGLDFLIGLLSRGRLDAAWLPSSVNLAQRLDEAGLQHLAALGWERVYLDLSGADLSPPERRRLASAIDRSAMHGGFVREEGRVADTLHPEPGATGAEGPYEGVFRGPSGGRGVSVQLSAPVGDELLELIQRLVQVQLDTAGFDVELVNVDARRFYGSWARNDPVAGAFRRSGGAPGWEDEPAVDLDALPLLQVDSVIASGGQLQGLEVNPTIEGPLWNAEAWHLAPGAS